MVADRKPMSSSYEANFFQLLERFSSNVDRDEERNEALISMLATREFQLSPKGLERFRQECIDKLKPAMERLMAAQNKSWADAWVFVVEQMGVYLHSDNKFLNSMLSVLEAGMKRKEEEAMRLSLGCWVVLIDNFALSPKMIMAQRRVSLLTIPLKAKNVREAEVVEIKFKVWWRLFLALGVHTDLHVESATKPFLIYAFGPFDQSTSHLLSKFPSVAKLALNLLTALVATGVADLNFETEFRRQMPFIKEDKAFLCLAEWIVRSINALLQHPEPLPAKPLEVLLTATFHRINSLYKDNPAVASDALALLLKVLRNSLAPSVLTHEPHRELLLATVEAALQKLSEKLLDSKLKNLDSTSPRDCFFKLLCCPNHLLMHAKPTISKIEEKQFVLLEKLMTMQGTLVNQPDRLARVILLENALNELQEKASDADVARKCFHLWEQCCRFLPKIPREYSSQEANQLAQKAFLELLLLPFRVILVSGLVEGESSIVYALKNLFFSYSEIVHLSLSVDKEDPCKQLYAELVRLLERDELSPPAFQLTVKIVYKFAPARTSIHYTKFFGKSGGHEAERAELQLLSRLIGLLCTLAPKDPAAAGKSTPLVAKALGKLVLLVNSSDVIIESINLFHQLFTHSPVNHWPSNRMDVTDPWSSIVTPFKRVWADVARLQPALEELKPKLESLIEHRDVKVCNAANEMLSCYSQSTDSQSSQDSTTPVQRIKPSRKRSFLNVTQPTPPAPVSQTVQTPPSQKYLPGKPSLEDLDSQDFVKIPSQPKMKKPLTPHQKEVKKRRRDDIPALYQGLSQEADHSQDTQDSLPIVEPLKETAVVTAPFAPSVWDEEAVDIDLVSARNTSLTPNDENSSPVKQSDENKSMNFQEELLLPPPQPASDEEMKIKPDSIEDDLVENSQTFPTIPVQSEARPDPEQTAQTLRTCNRQGVALPAVKASKEVEKEEEKEVVAPTSKRKSSTPVRGAGLKNLKGGRAATMLGLVKTKETKQPEAASVPQQVMSILKTPSDTVTEKQNNTSPVGKSGNILVETPVSSSRKRSNLKKDKTDESPSPKRSKRVSFAEPVVSGQQDSPKILQDPHVYQGYYQRFSKKLKSSRKLSMINKPVDDEDLKPLLDYEIFRDEPLIPALCESKIPASSIVGKLTTPELQNELLQWLEERKIKTLHDFNLLSGQGVSELPISEPKTVLFVNVLMDFAKDLPTQSNPNGDDSDWKDSTELRETLIDKLNNEESAPLPRYFDSIPSIETVTTHQDTIPVIEEVVTPPEIESPEIIEKVPEEAEAPPVEVAAEETTDEDLSPDLIESSLEQDSETKIDVPAESSVEATEEKTEKTCKSAEELFNMLSESEKEKFRLMFAPIKDEKHPAETVREALSDLPSLDTVFTDIEDKVCEALPLSTIENRVCSLLQTDASFLSDLPARDLLKPVSDKALAEEVLRRLQNGVVDPENSTDALRSFFLGKISVGDVLCRLKPGTLSSKLDLKELLVEASDRAEEPLVDQTASDALEKLASCLPFSTLERVLCEHKSLDEETALRCIRVLMTHTSEDKVVDLMAAVRLMVDETEGRKLLLDLLLKKVEDGEVMTAFGQKRITDLMTVGVLSGDVNAQEAINDVFCAEHIVEAACGLLQDGASEAHLNKLLDAFPRDILAAWVAGLILQ
ncbi:uncharacterized protein LOC135938824 [Cloeon dipterum]|uniref:uncharacterized protein LOC135938824 n=1 Tax=Cloeon dipterum TaxID=197152 RepID=UPI00321FC95B